QGYPDVRFYDRATQQTTIVAFGDGREEPSIFRVRSPKMSADGQVLALYSGDPQQFVRGRGVFISDHLRAPTLRTPLEGIFPDLSADGRFVGYRSFPRALDVFPALLYDRDPDNNGVFDEPGLTLTEV